MGQRRGSGRLEHEVLAALWGAEDPLTPEQVRLQLGGELAYTTVHTTLVRLLEKGAVARAPAGRGHSYAPVLDDTGMAALRLRRLLEGEADRAGVLHRFAADLDAPEAEALRRALDRAGSAGPPGPGSRPSQVRRPSRGGLPEEAPSG